MTQATIQFRTRELRQPANVTPRNSDIPSKFSQMITTAARASGFLPILPATKDMIQITDTIPAVAVRFQRYAVDAIWARLAGIVNEEAH